MKTKPRKTYYDVSLAVHVSLSASDTKIRNRVRRYYPGPGVAVREVIRNIEQLHIRNIPPERWPKHTLTAEYVPRSIYSSHAHTKARCILEMTV